MSGALVALGMVVAGIAGTARATTAHPLHTTFAEVSLGATGDVEIRLRAFIDDFSAAVARLPVVPQPPFSTPGQSATARYLAERVVMSNAAGRRVPLTVTEVRREGDVVWVTLRAVGLRSHAGARLTNTVLFERYDDQVNIVQTNVRGRRLTLLFATRDGSTPRVLAS